MEQAFAGCSSVIVHGFSNGASAAASLFCGGETFGRRVEGYLIDDWYRKLCAQAGRADRAVDSQRAPAHRIAAGIQPLVNQPFQTFRFFASAALLLTRQIFEST